MDDGRSYVWILYTCLWNFCSGAAHCFFFFRYSDFFEKNLLFDMCLCRLYFVIHTYNLSLSDCNSVLWLVVFCFITKRLKCKEGKTS
jgi:hypothetical protein